MKIHSNNLASMYSQSINYIPKRQESSDDSAIFSDKMTISQAARDLFEGEKAKLSDTQANNSTFQGQKGTIEHLSYLISTDSKFAELTSKEGRSSSELEYMARLTGLPNQMNYLNPKEITMYDDLINSGNFDAASAVRDIGAIRSGMTLGSELTDDLSNKMITADNIRNYFSKSINDKSGVTQKHFDALISYLEKHPQVQV